MHASFARVVVNGSDAAVMLGGRGANELILRDAWLLVFDSINLDQGLWPTCGWLQLSMVGDMHPAVDAAPLTHVPPGHAFLKHDFIMFGGCIGQVVFRYWRTTCLNKSNAVSVADLDAATRTLNFTRVQSAGDPLARVSFSELIVSDDAVYILGGFPPNGIASGPRILQSRMLPVFWQAKSAVNEALQWEKLVLPAFYGKPSAAWDADNEVLLLAGILYDSDTKVQP
jgi:hypothetical protein